MEFDIDFRRNPYKGLYIAVEGIDGSGKTTQVEELRKYFRKQGREVVCTREPRKKDGMIADLVQKILHGKTKIPPVAFQYLFSADREMHHEELVIPSLEKGKVVISDRCFWSSVPYGLLDRVKRGSGRKSGLDKNTIEYLLASQCILSMYHEFIVPDITFYLDIPLNVAVERINRINQQREIYEEKGKLEKIIGGYEWLIREFPKEFIVIEGTRSVEEVTRKIVNKIQNSKFKSQN